MCILGVDFADSHRQSIFVFPCLPYIRFFKKVVPRIMLCGYTSFIMPTVWKIWGKNGKHRIIMSQDIKSYISSLHLCKNLYITYSILKMPFSHSVVFLSSLVPKVNCGRGERENLQEISNCLTMVKVMRNVTSSSSISFLTKGGSCA